MGDCGWTRCPRNSDLNHIAQDTTRSPFWCCFTQTARAIRAIFSHFWAVPRTYRGVRGQQSALCHGAIEVHVQRSNRFPSFGRFDWVLGPFLGQKRLFWGTKCAGLGGHLSTRRPGHGRVTTTGPDATHPPAICQNSGGGGSGGGGRLGGVGGGFRPGGGGFEGGGACARPTTTTCIPPRGCVSGGWGVRRYVCDNSAFSSLPRRKS